jgi:hypothetical protein
VSRLDAPREEAPLRDLFASVIDNIKGYVSAEITLVKVTVTTRAGAAIPAIAMLVAAVVLLQAGLTVLAAALGALFAIWLGWAGGLALSAVLVLAGAGLLVWLAIKRLAKAFG